VSVKALIVTTAIAAAMVAGCGGSEQQAAREPVAPQLGPTWKCSKRFGGEGVIENGKCVDAYPEGFPNDPPPPEAEPSEPEPASDPIGQRAADFVRDYYALLNRRDFDSAWARLSPGLQGQLGPRETWEAGYAFTEGTDPDPVTVVAETPDWASLAVTLASDDLDACGDYVPQRFQGKWEVMLEDGNLVPTEISFEKVSGRTPVTDPLECRYYEPVEPPATYEPPPEFYPSEDDPTLPGTRLYEAPTDFCDYHDCIPNFENGTGYPVQCTDGSWSQSGGRPGACSWHGGVGP
jgi:hypothetical protein